MVVQIENNYKSEGTGFIGLLTILFIALKLCNVIDWSWWWVLSPMWISFGLVIAFFIIVGISMIIYGIRNL